MAQEVGARGQGTTGYRIRRGNVVAVTAMPWQTSLIPFGRVRVVYDDGGEDDLYFDPSITTTAGTEFTAITKIAARDGWVVDGAFGLRATGFPARASTAYGVMLILSDVNASDTLACIGQGIVGLRSFISVGHFETNDYAPVFVFQGTILEDATAGTHVCTLTVTPGTGNSFRILYGRIVVGNTATSQTASGVINDGTNTLTEIVHSTGDTVANRQYNFPANGSPTATFSVSPTSTGLLVSGTMAVVLTVSTAAVSVTHTFSLVLQLLNGLPSTVLNDTIGASTNTTNTSGVF